MRADSLDSGDLVPGFDGLQYLDVTVRDAEGIADFGVVQVRTARDGSSELRR